MKKIKMAYAGGRSLGVDTLEWLCTQDYLEIVAVCLVPRKYDENAHDAIIKVVDREELNICDISELLSYEIDIGLSVNYHRIIGEDILCHCRKGFYNLHHSYNLRLRGRNIATHAILNTLGENVFYHGTTLHKMVPELDAGPIIVSEAVEICPNDTANTLFRKTDERALSMIIEWVPRLACQNVFPYDPPKEGIHYYRNKDLPSRKLDANKMSAKEINTYIRAFDFPGKEPAFIDKDGRKIHLVYTMRDEFIQRYDLNGRTYFTDIG